MADKVQARTRGTFTVIQLTNGERLLVAEIGIDCDVCGQHTVRYAGHHLRAIRDLLIEAIDLHPELTRKDAEIQTLERLRFGGIVPPDPGRN